MINPIQSSQMTDPGYGERSLGGEGLNSSSYQKDESMAVEEMKKEEKAHQIALEKEKEQLALQQNQREELMRAEEIALKIAGGERLTSIEMKLIAEKFPDLFYEAQSAKRVAVDLIGALSKGNDQESKDKTIMQEVKGLSSEQPLTPIQAKIRIEAIRYVEKFTENKEILPYFQLKPGSILDEKR